MPQALRAEFAAERFNECVVGRFARPREVERHIVLICSQVEIG